MSDSEINILSDSDVATGHEFSIISYPVSESPLLDLINAYRRAFQQLSTLQRGRYAYAQDWNVLADYAKAIINVLARQFKELLAQGETQYAKLYRSLLECHRILSTYRYLRTGDIITPDRTNTLIDVAKCLDAITSHLLAFSLARRRERDVARGLDQVTRFWEVNCLVLVAHRAPWTLVRKYVVDGTIVFVDYGTQEIPPEEVREIVDTMHVAFAILVDTQPTQNVDAGSFYDVFYTVRHPAPVSCSSGCVDIYDEVFSKPYGLYGCTYGVCGEGPYVWTHNNCSVSTRHKVGFAKRWTHPETPVDYAYAKYGAGGIIELPHDGTWASVEDLNALIGKIAVTLLGEEPSCTIAVDDIKLRQIIWMAGYKEGIEGYHRCPSTDECLRELASRVGCLFIQFLYV